MSVRSKTERREEGVDCEKEKNRLRITAYHASTKPSRDELFQMWKEAGDRARRNAEYKSGGCDAEPVSRSDFDDLCDIVARQTREQIAVSRRAASRLKYALLLLLMVVVTGLVNSGASVLAILQVTDVRVGPTNDLTTKDGRSLVSTSVAEQAVPLKWVAFLPVPVLEKMDHVTLLVSTDWDEESSADTDYYVAHYEVDGFELLPPRLANATTGASYRPARLTLFTTRGDMIVAVNERIELVRPSTGGRTQICGRASCARVDVGGVDVASLEERVETFLRTVPSGQQCRATRRGLDTQTYNVLCNVLVTPVAGSIGEDAIGVSCTQDAMVGGCTTCHLNAPNCKNYRIQESPANGCACCK